MPMDVEAARLGAAQTAYAPQDMGPLAWILDELRNVLDAASRAVTRAAHEAQDARDGAAEAADSAMPVLADVAALHVAHKQLHQGSGALQMVGLSAPALIIQGMEAAVQRLLDQPALCTVEAAATLEQASYALAEYLQTILAGKNVSAVALFPQYRDTQALAGNDKIHPADLWPTERRLREPQWPDAAALPEPLPYGAQARAQLDGLVLRLIKGEDRQAAAHMRDLALRLAAGCAEKDVPGRRFWKVAAGFFDGQAGGLIGSDVYVKRMASRVLIHYTALARASTQQPARLLQDLLFFCAQAHPAQQAAAALAAVRAAHGMHQLPRANYHIARFGRHTPSMHALAQKRVAAAAATWSALAGGEKVRTKQVQEHFALLAESLVKIYPASHLLARALIQVSDTVARIGQVPPAELAMEVATAILFLQSVFAATDLGDEEMTQHAASLAQRLQLAQQGEGAGPLQHWMEELYRHASDQQTIGSVVQELRLNLDEVERQLDQYFRDPSDISALAPVSGKMAQMRGVLALLEMTHAVQAMAHMRDVVDQLVLGEITEEARRATFEKLGNNLGAMGFLIDMLSYQRNMAKKLFVWEEEKGVLRMFSARRRGRRASDDAQVPALPPEEAATVQPPREVLGAPVQPAAAPPAGGWPPISAPPEGAPLPTLHPPAPDESGFGPLSEFGPLSGFGAPDAQAQTSAPAAVAAPASDTPAPVLEPEPEVAEAGAPDSVPEAEFSVSIPDVSAADEIPAPLLEPEPEVAETAAPDSVPEAEFSVSIPDVSAAHELPAPLLEPEPEVAETAAPASVPQAEFSVSIPDVSAADEIPVPILEPEPEVAETAAPDSLPDVPSADEAPAPILEPEPEVVEAAAPDSVPQAQFSVSIPDVSAADEISVPILEPEGETAAAAETAADFDFQSTLHAAVPLAPLPPQETAPASAAPAAIAPLPVSAPVVHDAVDDELLPIFLEEAGEVVAAGQQALRLLADGADNYAEQTTLRRAFHTLKGSSRMVGLNDFGEAAWALEQMLNAWLAEHQPMPAAMQGLAGEALEAFGRWARDLAQDQASGWHSAPFRNAADAMRLHGQRITLDASAPAPAAAAPIAVPAVPAAPPAAAETTPAPQPPSDLPADFLVLPPAGEAAEAGGDAPLPDLGLRQSLDWSADKSAPAAAADETTDAAFPALPALDDEVPAAPPPPPAAALEPPAGPVPALLLPELDSLHTSAAANDGPQERATAAAEKEAEKAAEEKAEEKIEEPAEEQKIIGSLRLTRALYDVFMEEARRWLAQLDTLLRQWQQDWPQRATQAHGLPPPQAAARAHTLAGSAGAIGFDELAQLARLLEHALAHVQVLGRATGAEIGACMAASGELHRLLAQFADGTLAETGAPVRAALQAILAQEVHEAEPEAVREEVREKSAPPPAAPAAPAPQTTPQAAAAPVPALADVGADQVDHDLFPFFEEEALELLPRLGAALRRWHERPGQHESRAEVLRALHTLKGSARLTGAMGLGEMAHQMETQASKIDEAAAAATDIEPLLHSLDALQGRFDALRALYDAQIDALAHPPLAPSPVPASAPLSALASAASVAPAPQPAGQQASPASAPPDAAPATAPSSTEPSAKPSKTAEKTAAPPAAGSTKPAALAATAPARAAAAPPTAAPVVVAPAMPRPASVPTRPAATASVRVRAALLDNLIGTAGEILVARSRIDARLARARHALGDMTENLERLRAHLRDVEIQSESQMQSRMAQAQFPHEGDADFDPLEFDRFTRVQELTRMMAESVNDVATVQHNLQRDLASAEDELASQARQTRLLQTDLLHTRMVEFDSMAERLHTLVRQVARELGKLARLSITGASIEMDRSVLERMMPAFEHLLRNCLAHGIEAPAQRRAAGKPETGVIDIILEQDGSDVALTVQDDGCGLDVERIRAKAVEKGLWPANKPLDAQEAGRLIFAAGLTTASQVTGLAGRGVGMDVVRNEVTALGGHIHTRSESGKGSAFRMVLPLTTAVTQVLMVRAGPFVAGVPVNLIEIVRRAPLEQIAQAYASRQFDDGGRALPFYWGGALWQASRASSESVGRTRPVLIVRSAAQRVAVHVDEVLGNQEVVVKNLGPQLSRLPGLTGMSVLPSGALVQIYNPVALAGVYGAAAYAMQAAAADGSSAEEQAASASAAPLILVVDDSITVRRVTQRMLQREGYRVQLANDGLHALDCLQQERPALVLSDIEMPRMDGFDLLRNIRADSALADLPVVMITSRIAQKHRDMAQQLGANHYLGKPYSDEALLDLIHHYTVLVQSGAEKATE